MEETRKRESEENDVESLASPVKRPRPETVTDGAGDLGEDIMAWLSMDDDTVGELMNFLDTTNAETTALTRIKFINNPYTTPLIFQSSSSYVTINGNEESCGSSFSDSESSVMVSVDMSGIVNAAGEGFSEWEVGFESGALCSNVVVEGGRFVKGGEMDGCDGSDLDDYVLARFLGEDGLY